MEHELPSKQSPSPTRKPTKVNLVYTLALALASCLFIHFSTDAAESIRVERHGTSHGPAVLLIPGLSCGGDVWDGTVTALQEEYDLHVVTLAGFAGLPPVDPEGSYLTHIRDSIIGYIRQESLESPAIVGHSMGGFLAYSVASQYPKEIGAVVAVDGLPFYGALMNPAASPEARRESVRKILASFERLSVEAFRAQNEWTLRTMIRDPLEVERIAATSGLSDPSAVGRAMAELVTTDIRADLGKITAPILQFGAFGALGEGEMRDTMTARYRDQLAAAPQAIFVETSTLHFVMLDNPTFFNDRLRSFLKEHLGKRRSEVFQGDLP